MQLLRLSPPAVCGVAVAAPFFVYKSHLPPFHNAFPADSGMSTQYLYDFHNYLHILIYIQKKLAFAFIIVYLCRKISGRLPSGQRAGWELSM